LPWAPALTPSIIRAKDIGTIRGPTPDLTIFASIEMLRRLDLSQARNNNKDNVEAEGLNRLTALEFL
jgi:hypothetical protein